MPVSYPRHRTVQGIPTLRNGDFVKVKGANRPFSLSPVEFHQTLFLLEEKELLASCFRSGNTSIADGG
jgi:hypothetical protein